MSTQDFKLTFLNNVWKEMEKVTLAFAAVPALQESLKAAAAALAESKTNIKDMFRFFKDI